MADISTSASSRAWPPVGGSSDSSLSDASKSPSDAAIDISSSPRPVSECLDEDADGNQTYFYFMLFERLGHMRYALFSLGFVLYCVILFLNTLIILAVCLERTMHQPMYILILCLSINSVYGTAAFFPRVLTDLLSNTNIISYEACFLQSFVIFSYTANEFAILMLMAFDRFVAISKPLQYHNIITSKSLIVLIVINWMYPFICLGIGSLLTARLQMCDNKLWKVYCHNYEIVKLSCVNSVLLNLWGFFVLFINAVIPFIFIFYSYVKILFVCHRSSSKFKSKAYQTCLYVTIIKSIDNINKSLPFILYC
ncbi:olfactory receptor 7C1-like [Triplophysa dalaica]|uniref:olfactory receptor 7C1-like n=1 Tax=Triplophysa dalaica TaxID=1582913 RepID=UPI0024E02719|nr:olfactory receptor 7C1-like [Triplophysa dalaica]